MEGDSRAFVKTIYRWSFTAKGLLSPHTHVHRTSYNTYMYMYNNNIIIAHVHLHVHVHTHACTCTCKMYVYKYTTTVQMPKYISTDMFVYTCRYVIHLVEVIYKSQGWSEVRCKLHNAIYYITTEITYLHEY